MILDSSVVFKCELRLHKLWKGGFGLLIRTLKPPVDS